MTRLATLLSVICMAGLLATAGGCVSKADYDKAVAASRRAHDELLKCQEALAAVRADNQRLAGELQLRDAQLAAKQNEIDILAKAKNDLQNDYDRLAKLYNDLKGSPVPPPVMPQIALPADLDKLLRELADKYSDILVYDARYGMVKFKTDLTFEKGKDTVLPAAREALAKFAQIVNGPTAQKFNVYIAGHTDDIPIKSTETKRRHPTNWYLSVHRSVAVQEVLTEANVAPVRIGTLGFSEYHPVEANAPGNKGNQANRRVEIWIVPPDKLLTRPLDSGVESGEKVDTKTK